MLITKQSPFSGKTHQMEISVTQAQLDKWQQGELIQRAMPNLSPDEREFILTGISKQEWNDAFVPPCNPNLN